MALDHSLIPDRIRLAVCLPVMATSISLLIKNKYFGLKAFTIMPIYMEDIAINRKEQHGSVLPTRIIYDLSKPSTLFSNDFK